MAPRGKVDQNDFESLEDRQNFALNLKEGLDPEGVFDDLGDYEEDDRSRPTQRDDIHCSTPEEIQQYYDERRPSGWWPL